MPTNRSRRARDWSGGLDQFRRRSRTRVDLGPASTDANRMLEHLAQAGPLIVLAVGATIAFMVYRLNSERLFLDMLSTRRKFASGNPQCDRGTEAAHAGHAEF